MRHYTHPSRGADFEIQIAAIYFSDTRMPRSASSFCAQSLVSYLVTSSLRFTWLTKWSASRVGRGIRTPSLTASVNRKAVSGPMALHKGDRLQIGRSVLEVTK